VNSSSYCPILVYIYKYRGIYSLYVYADGVLNYRHILQYICMYTCVDTMKYQRYEFLIILFLSFLLPLWRRAIWAVAILSVTFVYIRSGTRRWDQFPFHHFWLILTEEGITISICALTEWTVILRQSLNHNIDFISKELFPVLVEGTEYICQLILLPKLAICKCANRYWYTCLYDILTS